MSSATFTRSSTAYNPETGAEVAVNEPRFVAGPFPGSKALFVEEGTENIIPLERQKFVGWAAYRGTQVTLTQDQVVPEWGATDATRIQTTGGSSILKYLYDVGALTGTYSLQLRVKNQGTATMRVFSNVGGRIQDVAPGQSVHVKWDNIVGAGVGSIQIQLRTLSVEGNLDLIAWRPMVEAKPYATSFHPGTRSPESPTIPTAGVLSFDEGTIELRFKPSQGFFQDGSSCQRIIGHASGINKDEIELMRNSTTSRVSFAISNHEGQAQGGWNNLVSTTNLVVDTWYHIAVRWSFADETYAIFVNGVKESEKALSETYKPSVAGVTAIGYHPNVATRHCDSAISDLRISNIARSDAEILAAYQSGAPLQADADTTYLLPLNGDLLNLANQGGSVTRLSVRGIGAGSKEARQGSPSIARASISSQGSGLAIKQGGRITRVSLTTISGHGLPIKQGGSLSSLLLLSSGQGMRFRATRGRTEILTGEGNIVNVADSKREVILI